MTWTWIFIPARSGTAVEISDMKFDYDRFTVADERFSDTLASITTFS